MIATLRRFYSRMEKKIFVRLLKKRLYYLTLDSHMLDLENNVLDVLICATLDLLISKLEIIEHIMKGRPQQILSLREGIDYTIN